MLQLDGPSQRWFLTCDSHGCTQRILASEGTHAEQRAELDRLAPDAGWRHSPEVGHLCRACSVQLAPPIPREDLCRRDVWCVAKEGHAGRCWTASKRAMPPVDLTHRTVKKRWG